MQHMWNGSAVACAKLGPFIPGEFLTSAARFALCSPAMQKKFGKPIMLWGSDTSASHHSELGVVAGLLSELCVQRMLLWDAPDGGQAAGSQRAQDLLDVYRYLQYTK
jgi:hypothetical protein